MVGQQSIVQWVARYRDEDRIFEDDDISFGLYYANDDCTDYYGEPISEVAFGSIANDGTISFENLDIPAGWYAIVEELTGHAKHIFRNNDGKVVWYVYYLGNSQVDEITGGIVSVISDEYVESTFTIWNSGGGNRRTVQLIHESGATTEGTKPDGSGQTLDTWGFVVNMPDGSTVPSFCADLGAHNVFGNYGFDASRQDLSDAQILELVAALDYLNDLYGMDIIHGDDADGYALCQIIVWNAIIKTGAQGFAENYIPGDPIVAVIGYGDWYIPEYADVIDAILSGETNVVEIYNAKLASSEIDTYVSGVVWIKGNDESYDPIDQQRQIFVLFGNPTVVNKLQL
jgi:hypothetical protein